jgi:hypothetical protein
LGCIAKPQHRDGIVQRFDDLPYKRVWLLTWR